MGVSESRDRATPSPEPRAAAGVRVVGLIGWALIFGAFLVWEGLGLTLGHQWPTLSHMLRVVTRPLPGRLVLFGLWLWVGWHLFIRGWDFFLRGPLPEAPSPGGSGGLSLGQMWQQAIVPLTGFYALFLGMLAFSARRQLPDDHDTASEAASALRAVDWLRAVPSMLLTVAAGYGFFVAMIGAYVLVSGSDPGGLLGHAIRGGALLAFGVVVPGFILLSWTARLKRRRRVCRAGRPTLG